jgi:hypothetical protein
MANMEKSKLKSEKIRKIWKKSKLKSEKIWEIQKKGKLNSEKDMENTARNIKISENITKMQCGRDRLLRVYIRKHRR